MHRNRAAMCATIVIAHLTFGVNCSMRAADGNEQAALKEKICEVLSWLPIDTETIVVCREDCRFDQSDRRPNAFNPAVPCGSDGALHVLRRGAFLGKLNDRKVAFAIQASCQFHKPTGRGAFRYAGGQIVCFQDDLGKAGDDLMSALFEAADERNEIEGFQIAVFQEAVQHDRWSFLVARPKPNVLVVATDKDYLHALLTRITRRNEEVAFPTDLPEWRHIDFESGLWALRRYCHEPQRVRGVPVPPEVRAFTWYLPSRASDAATIRITASDDIDIAALRRAWSFPPPGSEEPSIRRSSSNTLEITHSLNTNDAFDVFFSLLMAHLGHDVAM